VAIDNYQSMAEKFIKELPYKQSPYNGRNWGHSWHSLCSYHGKLKPAIAHFLIENFTKTGDVILDPLCGVGTIPFEAALQGRKGIGNDLSEMAFCVTKAKLEKPSYKNVAAAFSAFENFILSEKNNVDYESDPYKSFGLNHTLAEYFHRDTYCELIAARRYLLLNFDGLSAENAVVFSALLHVLHGNRPYALSRTSHPLTPYAPRGEYVYKNVASHVKDKIDAAYACNDFQEYKKGKAIWGDYSCLKSIKADAIITSPPFADSIRFYSQNWMRLWLCGWEPADFKTAGDKFLDQKQNSNLDVYVDFFDMCARNLKDSGIVILHLGKTKKIDMAEELSARSQDKFETVYFGNESVEALEKHGIKDKGGTTAHQFLFLRKK